MVGIVVTDSRLSIDPHTIPHINGIARADDAVIEGYHHRGYLEGRSWLREVRDRHIGTLGIASGASTLEVRDRHHLTGLDLHQYDGATLGI